MPKHQRLFLRLLVLLALAGMVSSLSTNSYSLISSAHADGDGDGDGDGGGGDGDGDGGGDGGDGGGDGGDGGDGGGDDAHAFESLDVLAELQSEALFEEFTLQAPVAKVLGSAEVGQLVSSHWGRSPVLQAERLVAHPTLMAVEQVATVTSSQQGAQSNPKPTERDSEPVIAQNYAAGLDFRPLVASTDDDVAIIIGNKTYQVGSDIPAAAPALNDSLAFEKFALEALQIRPGNVLRLENAGQAAFYSVFGSDRSFKGKLHDWVRPGRSRVYVYYSGHGAPGQDDAFLIPADTDASRVELNGYPISLLYKNLAALKARSTMVVFESCFSGVSQSGSVIKKASPLYVRPNFKAPPSGLTVYAASGPSEIASWAPDSSRGLFTSFLLRAFAGEADKKPYGNGDGQIGTSEVRAYLNENLSYWSRRHYGRDQTAVLIGEFPK